MSTGWHTPPKQGYLMENLEWLAHNQCLGFLQKNLSNLRRWPPPLLEAIIQRGRYLNTGPAIDLTLLMDMPIVSFSFKCY